ncbi:hypothetical protein H0H87_003048, partial [Tephrocybe sp. NHM501043]
TTNMGLRARSCRTTLLPNLMSETLDEICSQQVPLQALHMPCTIQRWTRTNLQKRD